MNEHKFVNFLVFTNQTCMMVEADTAGKRVREGEKASNFFFFFGKDMFLRYRSKFKHKWHKSAAAMIGNG